MPTTDNDRDMRSPSPSGSVLSFSSANAQDLIREFGGRLVSSQNETYMMPVVQDTEEHERLEYQHRALTLTLDSLYAAPDLVRAAMMPSQSYTPAAVDLGTGSGQWAVEFAREFPHASVVGIDIAPPAPKGPVPPNCRFEVDDVNLPLDHYTKCFNVCHMRAIDHGVYDYRGLLYRVAQILRTNGVLLVVVGDLRLYQHDRTPFPVDVKEGDPGWCATQALFWGNHNNALTRGEATSARYKNAEWMSKCPYYNSVGYEDVYIPLGPWMTGLDARCTYIAQLMQANAKRILGAFRPVLIANGHDLATIDRLISMGQKELTEMRPRMYARWRWVWGVRNSTKWDSRLPEP
ncbi:hypothetical protein FRC03_004319 [Tulasnella sp. 419]|nr:hypothetical protein FRC03_004319 [Tulasnella sp. 419]